MRSSLSVWSLRSSMLVCIVAGAAWAPDHATAAHASPVENAPIVIAHRGASGHRPEHTLAAYRLALLQGADFIELDLVATKDGELVARHENALAVVQLDEAGAIVRNAQGDPLVTQATTNVADISRFADRLAVKRVDGRVVGGWFSEDFTLAELRSLRARERQPALRPGSRLYDDVLAIPTLTEAVALVNAFERDTGIAAGLYIELKHPTYFMHEGRTLDGTLIGRDLGAMLLARLQALDFTNPSRLYLQCFELAPLLSLAAAARAGAPALPLVQLFGDVQNLFYEARPYDVAFHAARGDDLDGIYGSLLGVLDVPPAQLTYADLATAPVLEHLARTYASGIGPPKHNVLEVRLAEPVDADGDGSATQRLLLTGATGALLSAARAAGLEVHPYTLRAEERYLVRAGARVLPVAEEGLRLLQAGVDGFFIDQPAEGRAAVEAYRAGVQSLLRARNAAGQLE